MRKIEARMVAAALTGDRMKDGNTEVVTGASLFACQIVTSVYLHGNLIAQNGGKGWGINLRGWNTPTTRSRVNALLQGLGVPGRVCTIKGRAHFNGKPIGHHDWVHVS